MAIKQKILFILHMPPPVHGAAMMGAYIRDSKLLKEEFDCIYVNLSASENMHEVGKFGLKKISFLFKNLYDILLIVFTKKIDLCYVTPTSAGNGFYRDFLLIEILKLTGVKLVVHFHNKASDKWAGKRLYTFMQKQFFKNVNIILLGKELLAQKAPYIGNSPVYFCPNGIPSTSHDVISKRNLGKRTKFLFVSNMMEGKGVYTLLDACNIVSLNGYDFQCDFVGAWKDISEEDFDSKRKYFGLENKVFAHGPKYDKAKYEYLEMADVFVFPSHYHGETFGLVLLEAMDYALPCITCDNGCIRSVMKDGETGFVIKQKDAKALAEKMIWAIENPERLEEMGGAGKRRFDDNYSLHHFETNLLNILKRSLV